MALRMASLSWQVQKQVDDLSGLVLVEDSKADRPLQDDEVLVEIRAASLNYRDLVIAKVCFHARFPYP
jgi:NADPH:quinone reductase-like Zn-dependent oxidoreductase